MADVGETKKKRHTGSKESIYIEDLMKEKAFVCVCVSVCTPEKNGWSFGLY